MEQAYGTINQALVKLFNHIMRIEERSLTEKNLSIREIHVIEAVCDGVESGDNAMNDIAARLRITPGSLTVAVRTLTNKGYLLQAKDPADKRIARTVPTEAGLAVNQRHQAFHHEMTDAIIGDLSSEELSALVHALQRVDGYFMTKENEQ
ncbi:MAG: MarR family winged helix-turn-helix transcriptional regulator [Eubacteriales bacterium]|nr:MarR family winged helix-turn-helix transcriptional regulator [Eubacteriales bacterium]